MKILHSVKSLLTSMYFLIFANGFVVALFVICLLLDGYENNVFVHISNHITATAAAKKSSDTLIKQALNTTWNLLHYRSEVFSNTVSKDVIDEFINPLSSDLMTAEGACGSYSTILCRTLNTMGFETRFAQMKVNGLYGGHIIIEAKTPHGWVVLDPLFNLQFINPKGQTAGFDEISANWGWFKKQLPAGYNPKFCYQGVRYTNWDKIPLLMPAIKQTLSLFMTPEQLQHFSLRSYFLRKYRLLSTVMLLFIVFFTTIIVKRLWPSPLKGANRLRLPERKTYWPGHQHANV